MVRKKSLSNRELTLALARVLRERQDVKVKPKALTKKEIAIALAKILRNQKRKEESKRIIREEKSIEEKVSIKALQESQLSMVKSTDFWKEHEKHHKGAKLEILESEGPRNSDSLRASLASVDLGYSSQVEEGGVSYGPAEQQHLAPSGGDSYMGSNDPNRPGFWATCTCGMTMEVDSNPKNNNTIEVKSYGVAMTSSGNASVYTAAPSGQAVSYGVAESKGASYKA
tara:strand:+ start:1891 stop:2571 length:681 start_codon:yes stop_codon:yes gene_type:complete